jgi:hypothetical protein
LYPIIMVAELGMNGSGELYEKKGKYQPNGDIMANLLRLRPRKTRGARSDSQRHRSNRRKPNRR